MSETVPFTRRPLARRACADEPGHDRRPRQNSGVWSCTLKTLTPLCLRASFSTLGDSDTAFLPGSSLRGMVRNVVEILGAGCLRFYEDGSRPADLETCNRQGACPACRLFGFVEGDFGWAGKVRFGDSRPARVAWEKYRLPRERPPHNQSGGPGWILFPHGSPRLEPGPVRCVAANQSFIFRVEYLNLDAEEYALLKFALTLRHKEFDLCHKLGYGKALGLGACTVMINNDKSAEIGPEIDAYLGEPGFQVFARHRRYR
jgi:hypothetical protein